MVIWKNLLQYALLTLNSFNNIKEHGFLFSLGNWKILVMCSHSSIVYFPLIIMKYKRGLKHGDNGSVIIEKNRGCGCDRGNDCVIVNRLVLDVWNGSH